MEQYKAVEIITQNIQKTNLVEAMYLKGSLARRTEDEFSNIDLYVIVKSENIKELLANIIKCLNQYHSILYFKENGSEIICIFDNGIYLNLYIHRLSELSMVDEILIIYDPNKLLVNYQKTSLEYNPNEVGGILDRFLLTALKFYKSYKRADKLISLVIASSLFEDLGILIRVKYEPDFARLGLKKFVLFNPTGDEYLDIANKLKVNSVLECVKMMFILLDKYINSIPILIAEHINFDFYAYTKRKIMSINL